MYEPLSGLEADAPVTLATHDGWKSHMNLAKSDKHNLSCLAPPKGERKRRTCLFKSPTSSTLCFGEPTLAKLNQEIKLCITKHIPLCDSSVHTATPFSVPSSSYDQTEFPTDTPG